MTQGKWRSSPPYRRQLAVAGSHARVERGCGALGLAESPTLYASVATAGWGHFKLAVAYLVATGISRSFTELDPVLLRRLVARFRDCDGQ